MARDISEETRTQRDAAGNSYRNDPKRTPTNHRGSSDVPVLFRFRNLQRDNDLGAEAPAAPTSTATQPKGQRAEALDVGTSRGTKSNTSKVFDPVSKPSDSTSSKGDGRINQPTQSVTAQDAASTVVTSETMSSEKKANRPWSTNAILLGLGIAVLFVLSQRNTTNQPGIASNAKPESGASSLASSGVEIPNSIGSTPDASSLGKTAGEKALLVAFPDNMAAKKSDEFGLASPLTAPKLPEPMELTFNDDANNVSGTSQEDPNTSKEGIASNGKNAVTIEGEKDDSLELPTSHPSVLIPSTIAESTTQSQTKSSAELTPGNRQPSPTVVSNPHVAMLKSDSQASSQGSITNDPKKVTTTVSTATPDLETAELFALRNRLGSSAMQSQQQAMARNRVPYQNDPMQQQWNSTPAGSVVAPSYNAPSYDQPYNPQATTVSGPTQAPMAYPQSNNYNNNQPSNYQYQPVQPAPAGYGSTNASNTPAAVNKPYVPISNTLVADPYMNQGNTSLTTAQPWQSPENSQSFATGQYPTNQYPANPYSAVQSTAAPYSPSAPATGGYQPLSPQFQSQPLNGN